APPPSTPARPSRHHRCRAACPCAARLAGAADPLGGELPARRGGGHALAPPRRADRHRARPADRGREPARSGRDGGGRPPRQGTGRCASGDDVERGLARDRAGALPRGALRPAGGLHPCGAGRHLPERARRQSRGAGAEPCRVPGAGARAAGRARLRHRRQRHDEPPDRRSAGPRGGGGAHACALSRLGAGAGGCDGRADPGGDGEPADRPAASPRRAAAGARHQRGRARCRPAGCAELRRGRVRGRAEHQLVRFLDHGRPAARGHRTLAGGDRGGAGRCPPPRALRRHRGGAGADGAGGVHGPHRRRADAVAAGDPGGRGKARL
ncbi:MAG: BUG/TctC family periplasmic protein, partial [uncultured Craurococcus sp.]